MTVLFFRDAILFACANSGTSIFAGFVIFSVLGYMAHQQGTTVDKVAESGHWHAIILYSFSPIRYICTVEVLLKHISYYKFMKYNKKNKSVINNVFLWEIFEKRFALHVCLIHHITEHTALNWELFFLQ